jgi:hypothetical protein
MAIRAQLFFTTRWSMVLRAQGKSPAADEALEKLCRIYWWSLYGSQKGRATPPRTRGILLRAFSPCFWNGETSRLFVGIKALISDRLLYSHSIVLGGLVEMS